MTPNAVKVSAAIAGSLSPTQLANYGNVLAPTYKSWQGKSSSYFTQNLPNAYSQEPGTPTPITYWVAQYDIFGLPLWAQSPQRTQGTYGSGLYPVSYSAIAPPIDGLS